MKRKEIAAHKKSIHNFMPYLETPLKMVGCWDWYENPSSLYQIFINNIYVGLVLFFLVNLLISLVVHLYTEWVDLMSNLDKIADGLPLLTSLAIVSYFAIYKRELYELVQFINRNFKWHSGKGLTNMTMLRSYRMARYFAYFYTGSSAFCVAMYVIQPVLAHLWTKQPLQPWIYMDATNTPYIIILFLRQCIAQAFVALALGQLGVFYVSTSILICGQLDLLCCSLRNARFTALLARGVHYSVLRKQTYDISEDEEHNYLYNRAQMTDSKYHYDIEIKKNMTINKTMTFDADCTYDTATELALCDCARMYQTIYSFKEKFEHVISPLLVLRVAQVTLYNCTLLYAATLKFDMITVEYILAVVLDIFVYCYFGNQIILQADRVSTAAYQSGWLPTSVRVRRVLLAMLQATHRPLALRAGRFLTMDLNNFLVIIKTSFSYYTLLVSVNEK